MADIAIMNGPAGFTLPPNRLQWDRKTGLPTGAPINEDAALRNRPNLYAANGASVIINETGPVVRLRINSSMIDVNFAAGEPSIVARYPSGASQPNNTPLRLDFAAPVSGVGGYLSILGAAALYDGRPLHAVMWVLLVGDPEWKLTFGDGITGFALGAGSVPTAPFVGAEGIAGAKIASVCFDASLAGNFDGLVLSSIHWTA